MLAHRRFRLRPSEFVSLAPRSSCRALSHLQSNGTVAAELMLSTARSLQLIGLASCAPWFTRVTVVACGLVVVALAVPDAALAAVGDALRTLTPAANTTVDNTVVDPLCDSQGGTSVAVVHGSKLAGVDHAAYPILLAVSCLDNGGGATAIARRSRINFIDPADPFAPGSTSGKVIKAIQTRIDGVIATPGTGWPHWLYRAEFNDLLACGTDGTVHAIDISRFTTTADGTATPVPRPPNLAANCAALGWDAEARMIYQGIIDNNGLIGVVRFKAVTPPAVATVDATFTTPCAPSGVAITGGVLVVACEGKSTILRLNKDTGAPLAVNGTLGVFGLAAGTNLNPDLGDLACDPVSLQRHPTTGKDQFKDVFWSRNGVNGNGIVALEFPAFTCGLPSGATTFRPGLGAPAGSVADAVPKAACFDGTGNVIDADEDGIPDCWETSGIDFDGNGTIDFQLCVPVDTNGDGMTDATECASPTRKDLFAEIDWMQFHKPDPKALSPAAGSTGVTSLRQVFAVAPVPNPDGTTGISIHFLVDEQVTFRTLAGGTASHVDELVFTPCTPPGVSLTGTQNAKSLSEAAEFDAIKKANLGTAAERANANAANILNAKRLVFRYVVIGHKQVGLNQGGASNSGCAEIGGDDAAITLGAFASTTVNGVSHPTGTLGEFTGTLLHEFGHTLGFRHGGHEDLNCKPNYLSVMSYSRQFPDSPIAGRRLDFSRAANPVLSTPATSGLLNESSLLEPVGLGLDSSLGVITQNGVTIFSSPDRTAFGPGAFSVATANVAINWNRSKQGPNPTIQTTPVTGDINAGPGGCDGVGTALEGHDDWNNLLFRFSAALDFGAGVHSTTQQEVVSITQEQEEELYLAADVDQNGIGDAVDCGSFACRHRIDIKPSFPPPKTIRLGTEATVTIAIFSETASNGTLVWDADAQIVKNTIPELGPSPTLTFSVGGVVVPVKTNFNGEGTCSPRDVADPVTNTKDGVKDALCQFPTSGLPAGTNWGIVSGYFTFLNPTTNETEFRAFRARQLVTILP